MSIISEQKVEMEWKSTKDKFCVMYNIDVVSQFYTVVRYNLFDYIIQNMEILTLM